MEHEIAIYSIRVDIRQDKFVWNVVTDLKKHVQSTILQDFLDSSMSVLQRRLIDELHDHPEEDI